jgi:vancomycin resistance protein YoaR
MTSRIVARATIGVIAALAAGLGLGLAFAGSSDTLAEGVQIAGVDVGGMSASQARATLERRSDALYGEPATFLAAGHEFQATPAHLGLRVDWAAAVDAARSQGDGFAPVRGIRRLRTRVFGTEVAPTVEVSEQGLEAEVESIARRVDQPAREASIVLRGLRPEIVPAATGRVLDRRRTEELIVRGLAGFSRAPVALPVQATKPTVVAATLQPVLAEVRTALASPVRLALGERRWRLGPQRIAELLALPRDGARTLGISGPGAERYFDRLAKRVSRKPVDAGFKVFNDRVVVVPSKDGVSLDVRATAESLLAAVRSPTQRLAQASVVAAPADRTTADAQAMGISAAVGTYTTTYGGTPNRIHNVQLVAKLIDKTLIAPGATFSFNKTTGERTAEKGFLEAPVIINGELQTGLGGGVCQVSTTVFNTAYEAGLKLTERTNHALYISHYPTGRDATVNYPELDLKFVNDTGNWLLLRAFVGSASLTVTLYGTPVDRKVVTETAPLLALARPTIEKVKDPTLEKGKREVEETGQPSRSTSVRRIVYDAHGKVLYDDRWSSYYRAEKKVVRIGTKKPAKPKDEPAPPADADPLIPAAPQP